MRRFVLVKWYRVHAQVKASHGLRQLRWESQGTGYAQKCLRTVLEMFTYCLYPQRQANLQCHRYGGNHQEGARHAWLRVAWHDNVSTRALDRGSPTYAQVAT